MSREAKAPSSSSHPQTSRTSTATQHPPHPPVKEPEHSNKENEQIEEDDSDFVLVVNKKKHQQQIESARKQRQSYDHQAEDYDHHNNYSRRRKYRDRGGGSGGEKGFRRKKNHDKENTQHKTGSTSSSSSHAAPVTLPTVSSPPPPPSIEPKPLPQQIQTIAPSARSFSVVVACGKSALQKQQTAPLLQSPPPPPPPPLPLQDQNESPVRLTNRQILMVVKPKQESLGSLGTGPSISSSIPDTSSLTSEETLDSIERKAFSSADVESNEGSFTTGIVEYVDAPVPKINPWVANRNAAQVLLQGGSSTLPGFPSVSESSGSSTNGEIQKPASPEPPKVEVQQKTRKQSKEIQKPKPEVKAPQQQKTPPPQSPTSFSEAVTSPKPKQEQSQQQKSLPPKKQEPELPKKQDEESIVKQAPATEVTPALPLLDQKPVYVREMQNGFRPGRGRGSYSASASAGRKIPSRTSVLMKVISGDRAEDWPTLGEALSSRAHKLSSSGDEESSEGVKKPTTAIGEDAVDSHVKVVDKVVVELNNKSSEVSRKSPPPPTQQPQQRTDLSKKQIPVSPPPTQNQNETTCSSDNDDDVNSSNKRRGSKQKWVPLDITTQEQRERGGYYEAPPQEYKKPGKGKHKYPSNHRYEGYSRAKGKENMGVNGGGEYSDYNYHRYGGPHSNHHNPRSNRPPNLPSRPPQQLSNQPQNSRPPRRHNSNPHHNHHHHNQHHHHRSTSTLSLNNTTAMNGSAHPYEILSPTGGPPDFADFAPEFTMTSMYPTVSEFIMPYVTNGYFPTPFTPPAGVILEPATADVVGPGPIVVATSAPPTSVPTTVAGAPIHGADIVLNDLVRTQIEYYLSEENLAKDFYLRRKMDQDGYLPVHLIATFPRVKQMTENFAVVLSAIQSSETLELKQDMSEFRTKINPEKWPIPDQPALSSSSLKESLDKTCINNNTHTSTTAGGGETLNPNVPEFVPKSRVFC